jgi:hypothetical protein
MSLWNFISAPNGGKTISSGLVVNFYVEKFNQIAFENVRGGF